MAITLRTAAESISVLAHTSDMRKFLAETVSKDVRYFVNGSLGWQNESLSDSVCRFMGDRLDNFVAEPDSHRH